MLPGTWNPQDFQMILNCIYSVEDKIDPKRYESVKKTAKMLQIDPKIFPVGNSKKATKSIDKLGMKIESDESEMIRMSFPSQDIDPLLTSSQDSEASPTSSHDSEVSPTSSQENETSLASSQENETSLASSQENETSLASSQENETSLASSQENESSLASSQDFEPSLTSTQEASLKPKKSTKNLLKENIPPLQELNHYLPLFLALMDES
jgi:hypothetical protein